MILPLMIERLTSKKEAIASELNGGWMSLR